MFLFDTTSHLRDISGLVDSNCCLTVDWFFIFSYNMQNILSTLSLSSDVHYFL